MAEETKNTDQKAAAPAKKLPKQKNPLIGAQAKPTVLSKETKLDIDTDKKLGNLIIEAGLSGGLKSEELENFTSISNSRDQIYQLIDTMYADSTVSAIVRTYAEDVCEASDNGHIVWCESDDPKISLFVNYLLNTMNVDKNVFSWATCLIKYGDVYLRLFRESDYNDPFFKQDKVDAAHTRLNESAELDEQVRLNLHKAGDTYSYYAEMVPDPGSMFELTKYGKTYGYIEVPNVDDMNTNIFQNYLGSQGQPYANYRMKSNDINIYQADDFVHASLDDAVTRYPERVELFANDEDFKNAGTTNNAYTVRRGKSLLYDSYKIWREKSLLEDAALLNRITRSSVVRNIQVEVGDMGKTQVQNTLRRVKEMFEQKSAVNTNTGMAEYNNPGAIENNIFTATHNGQGTITVNAIGGDIEVKNLADLDYWNNKYYSSYGIPKQFFGWTDDAAGFNGGTSLTIISSIYGKGVKRIQNAIIQMLTDAINLYLLNKGLRSYLNNFVLKMKAPLTQEEKDYRENLSNRISAISNFQSLLADIEDKPRRLEILRDLIGTLNYSNDIMQIIDEEREAVIAAQEKEAAEAELAETEGEGMEENAPPAKQEEPEATELPPIPMEAFTKSADGQILVEGPDFTDATANDNLPTPEELDEHKDFTQNI